VHRGNNRQSVFRSEGDYLQFRHLLAEAAVDVGMALHSYVLMPNHVHLLVTPIDSVGVSRAIHAAAGKYARYFNARYRRTGTLWEGRFHASLV